MNKRRLISTIVVFSFILSPLTYNVTATQYTIGITTDSEQNLAILQLDESTITREYMASMMKLYLGFSFTFIQSEQIVYGARIKWKVASINESAIDGTYTGWGIYFAVWNWSNYLIADNDTFLYIFINDDPSNEVNTFLCAKPVSTYLDELSFPDPHTLNGYELTREITFLNLNFTFVYKWDSSTGFLSDFKIIYLGNVILEIGVPGLFFGYEIPIILGIVGVSILGIGIIIFLRKRPKSRA